MAFRKRMSRGKSKKNFRRGGRIKTRNFQTHVSRGGIRL